MKIQMTMPKSTEEKLDRLALLFCLIAGVAALAVVVAISARKECAECH